MRLDGVVLHGLLLRDAMLVAIHYMEQVYEEEPKRLVAWRKLAVSLGIPVAEDPRLAEQRRRRELAKVRAEFGDGD